MPNAVCTNTMPASVPNKFTDASERTSGYIITWYGTNAPIIRMPNSRPAHFTRQNDSAYPFSAPKKIEMAVLGSVILTEFQKPTWMPRHSRPVHALDQACTQGANVQCTGSANRWPRRTSSIGLTEV